jgi:hypothetical protein
MRRVALVVLVVCVTSVAAARSRLRPRKDGCDGATTTSVSCNGRAGRPLTAADLEPLRDRTVVSLHITGAIEADALDVIADLDALATLTLRNTDVADLEFLRATRRSRR